MGNQLSSCACGEKDKDPIPEAKKPLDRSAENLPEPGKKNKKKGLFGSKKSKKKGKDDRENQTPESSWPHQGSKEVINVAINRKPQWVTFRDDPEQQSLREESPTRRTLYPSEPDKRTAGEVVSISKRPLFLPVKRQTEFGPSVKSRQRSPVVRFVDDDIEAEEDPTPSPEVKILDVTDKITESLKEKMSKAEESGQTLPETVISRVQYQLAKQDGWLDLDWTIREQYNIVYVCDTDNKVPESQTIIQQIVVYVQRDVQKVYVFVSTEKSPDEKSKGLLHLSITK